MEILGEMLHYRTNSSNIVHAIVAARALARKVYDCYPSLACSGSGGNDLVLQPIYYHWSSLGAGTAKK
ncbi:protein of unknown function [Methanoculleus bourgensis]|uniref:Uncharacterized protein n=1 Tax=Methanoculleus bourgensis TaxID=83986 RepID=A0A0X3BKL2_9EURY|nr:protein of unknown function [Methanoculleus bourgensis]